MLSLAGNYTLGISSDITDPFAGEGLLTFLHFDPFVDMTTSASITVTEAAPVPEPATIALLGIGIARLAGGAARRKLKNKIVDNK